MKRDVIIACDFSSKEELYTFLELFGDTRPFLKIGMELFYREGLDVVREMKARGHKIFLDLKLHDIPNTVKFAARNIALLNVDLTSIHSSGTKEMMKYALEGVNMANTGYDTVITAITQLTSTSEERMQEELLINNGINETIVHYAKNAKEAGLRSVVCSPLEATMIKEACGEDFIIVTPGIRFLENSKGDQVRVTTPKMAKELGSTYIVVGRSITKATDPLAAYQRCVTDFCE